MRRNWRRLALLPLLCLSGPTLAHVSGGGIVDSYSGLLHPFTEPLHIITIVGLGLMLSQQGRAVPPQGWISYTIAALLGLIASNAGLTLPVYLMLYPLAAILGLLVAIKPVLPRLICLLLSIIVGFTLGIDSMTGVEGIGKLIVTVFSTTTGLGIALLIVIGWGDYFSRDWQKIGIRVIGSWIATSALLVFTLNLNTN
jgi:hydrogenase/urease accessory protein HupE